MQSLVRRVKRGLVRFITGCPCPHECMLQMALYGPVASGQKPYIAVHLSEQELYDLAVAHLAHGVTSGWPHHVLQVSRAYEGRRRRWASES